MMKEEYNSKMEKNMESFIQLRIEGKSFDEIAIALKISKQSLIEWNKELKIREAISEGKALKINALIKAYHFDLEARLKTYISISKKVNDEILKRDLKDMSTDSLLKMSIANDTRLKEIIHKKFEFGLNPCYHDAGKDRSGFFFMQLDE